RRRSFDLDEDPVADVGVADDGPDGRDLHSARQRASSVRSSAMRVWAYAVPYLRGRIVLSLSASWPRRAGSEPAQARKSDTVRSTCSAVLSSWMRRRRRVTSSGGSGC